MKEKYRKVLDDGYKNNFLFYKIIKNGIEKRVLSQRIFNETWHKEKILWKMNFIFQYLLPKNK